MTDMEAILRQGPPAGAEPRSVLIERALFTRSGTRRGV